MADEVVKLVGNLNDLNSVSYKAGLEFRGLTKRLITMSDSIGGAGKKWTIFSRIVSGSPIWKLQNKVRAFVDSLALIEEASRKNSEAQKKADEQVINLVKSQQMLGKTVKDSKGNLTTEIALLAEKGKELEKLAKKQGTYIGSVDELLDEASIAVAIGTLTDNQRDAIENTLAFNKALLLGKTEAEAYAKGISELSEKAEQMEETFKDAQKAAKLTENLKIRDLSDNKELRKRKEGVKAVREQFGRFGFGGTERKKFKEDLKERDADEMSIGEKTMFELQKKRQQIFNFSVKYQKFMMGVGKSAKPLMNYAFKILIMVSFAIIAFIALAKVIYDAYGILQDFGVIDDIFMIGSLIFETAKSIIELIMAVVNGDVYKFIDKGEEIVTNLLQIGLIAGYALLKTIFALGVAVFYSGIDFIQKLLDDPALQEKLFKTALKALLLFGAIYLIKYIAIKLMEIAAIYALPLLIAVVILAGVTAIVKKFGIGNLFKKAEKFGAKLKEGGKKLIGRQTGGIVNERVTLVGEAGPELVSLPTGSRVHTNNQSKEMMSKVVNNVNVTINAKDTSDAELRRIADRLGNMITNKIQRGISSSGFVR